ncbi:MAG TPA: DeoR/GlpR family DNA-binding transcription regulator [Terriglobia bacterium]|nr:DeoR/GlpR family DNA-binding transcription regulator [Terriglobia bacterium]
MKGSSSNKRRCGIMTVLSSRGSMSVADLANQFSVSEMTVRRDLHELEEAGRVIRTPGGAAIRRAITFERDYTERLQKMAEAKEMIGREAALLVKAGESIVMDSGTTTHCMARHLRGRNDVVVITYSLSILDDLQSAHVELTGGVYRPRSLDLVGSGVRESLAKICANKVFFGAAAISFERGVTVNDPEAQRVLLKAGMERILVLDSSKVETEALYHFCNISDCDLIITDSGIRPESLRRLQRITKVLVADEKGPATPDSDVHEAS